MTVIVNDYVSTFWKNKRVLITGGTAGLGKSLALHLMNFDAHVAIVARNKDKLTEMRNISDKIITINADIGDINAIHRISNQAIGQMEGIDVLINNASFLGPTPLRSLIDTECEDLSAALETNLIGPFRLIKAVLPYMIFQGEGLIVNISSDAAKSAYPNWGVYSVSKAALDHLTSVWRKEVEMKKIEMVSLDPGDMYTQMHLNAIPNANPDDLHHPSDVARDMMKFLSQRTFTQSRFSANQWREEI